MNHTPIEEQPECECVYVHGAVASVLAWFLDPSVPWVWVLGHCPNPYLRWWKASVPINSTGSKYSGWVRNLTVDIQMPTLEFVARATEFDEHGLLLVQSHQRMPDTLCLERVPEPQLISVLKQNGATLRIYLPHAIETSQIKSFVKGYLSTKLSTEPSDGAESR